MELLYIMDEDLLIVDGVDYKATCNVRNELNGKRGITEIVKHTPLDGSTPKPYMPRKMPTGRWQVKLPIRTNPKDYQTYGSWKIPTSAKRIVALWETEDGKYVKPSGKTSIDAFYHLHASPGYLTTLGCVRLDSDADGIEIVKTIKKAICKGDKVWLEVVTSRK